MATSVYFNNFSPSVINENMLLEDLIVESIQIMGHDIKYLPREVYDQADDVLGESVNSKFTRAYGIEMYLANVEGYEGDGDFFSKFGLEIRDTSNFVVSRRSFEKYVPSTIASRPREGDLIFVPLLGKIYELRCEVFRFSNEDFETGDQVIDDLEHLAAYTVSLTLGNGTGNYHQDEVVYQGANLAYATARAESKHWIPSTKVLEVINVKGDFAANSIVIGVESNTRYNLTSSDTLADLVDADDSDNRIIQTEADTFIDLSEINPFGVP